MAFGGKLEDLPFSDVIQLLHVSKKSGILLVTGATGTARIVCRDGFIMDATFPGDGLTVSRLLLDADLVTREQLERTKVKYHPRRLDGARLVMALIDTGALSKERGTSLIADYIQHTLAEIISWKEGDFSFDVDDSTNSIRLDDLSVDMGPWTGIDTQGALMDAFRVFDEKNRELEEQKERKKERIKEAVTRLSLSPGPPSPAEQQLLEHLPPMARTGVLQSQELDDKDLLGVFEELDEETLDQVLAPPTYALFVSDNALFRHAMYGLCRDNGIAVTVTDVETDLRTAFERGMAEGHSIALALELPSGPGTELARQRRFGIASRLKEQNPELPLVFLCDGGDEDEDRRLFQLGARTILKKTEVSSDDRIAALDSSRKFNNVVIECLKGIFREEYRLRLAVQEARSEMASLKRRVQEIQDRENSMDISIIMLQFVAELMQRGIILLVRKNDLLGLGSFGLTSNTDTLSTATMRVRIPLDVQSAFSNVVQEGAVFRGTSADPVISEHLYNHIGEPASSDFLLLPLKTENRTIAVVYGDFGQKPASPTVKTDALEILASQAGMAMEIALCHARDGKRCAPSGSAS